MTPEKALYHKLMLTAGLTDQYEADLLHTLETEYTYSDIILELAYCQSDLNKTISVLHNYTLDKTIDENAVFDMVMSDLRNRYNSNSLTISETVNIMFKLSTSLDSSYDEPWCYMEYMYDNYSDAEIGLTTWDNFHQCFESFIQTGKFPISLGNQQALLTNTTKPKHSKKYWINLSFTILFAILTFVAIFITVHLTGSRDPQDFTNQDFIIFGIFILSEIIIFALEFFFAFRCIKLRNSYESKKSTHNK